MEIKLTFEEPLNHSLQVGDTVWYTGTSQHGGYDTSYSAGLLRLGTVEALSNQYRAHQVTISNYTNISQIAIQMALQQYSTFIMFSKDNRANLTSLTGYYALAKFENNSKEKAELYAVSSEVVESSK